jgi:hypothetical protein
LSVFPLIKLSVRSCIDHSWSSNKNIIAIRSPLSFVLCYFSQVYDQSAETGDEEAGGAEGQRSGGAEGRRSGGAGEE